MSELPPQVNAWLVIFIGIWLQAVPFLLLGTIISSTLTAFLKINDETVFLRVVGLDFPHAPGTVDAVGSRLHGLKAGAIAFQPGRFLDEQIDCFLIHKCFFSEVLNDQSSHPLFLWSNKT